jgi:hypothetical protein
MIAHRIIAPALNAQDLVAWRFHRRAGRDEAGHQFRFLFYSCRSTAQAIFHMIQTNSLLQEMKEVGLILDASFDDPPQPRFEGAGDETWPPVIQQAWPYYIHGVSRMWLQLIQEIAGERTHTSLDETLRWYRNANDQITALWRERGQHSFLHHLSAIFGYEPINVHVRQGVAQLSF